MLSSGRPPIKVCPNPLKIHTCVLGDSSAVLHRFLAKRTGLREVFIISLLNLRWTPQSPLKPHLYFPLPRVEKFNIRGDDAVLVSSRVKI